MKLSDEDKKFILECATHKDSLYPVFAKAELFTKVVDELSAPFFELKPNKVLGIEARGFILGGAVAYKLGVGFVVARKGGRMLNNYSPDSVLSVKFVDYTGKEKSLEIENDLDIIKKGDRILIIDDWFETGNQGHASISMIEELGAEVVGISVLIDDMSEKVKESFSKYNIHTLVCK